MNSAQEIELQGRPPIANGEYKVVVDEKGFRGFSRNAKDTGDNLQMTFKVISEDDSVNGRLIFQNFCVVHSNPKAQEISLKQINEYLGAVGANLTYDELPHREGLRDYINLELIVDVGTEAQGRNGYHPNNKIKGFKAL
jgi:hypothetical protein